MSKAPFFLLLIFLSFIPKAIFAQNNPPLIYLTYFDGVPRIDVVDARSLKRVDRILLEGNEPKSVILHSNKPIAFVANHFLFAKGVLVVDLVNRSIIRTLFPNSTINSIKVGLDGRLYVMLPDTNQVAIVNTDNFAIERNIQLDLPPSAIAFNPNKKFAYVVSGKRDQSFIDSFYELDLTNFSRSRVITNLPKGSNEDTDLIVVAPDGNTAYLAVDGKILIVDTNSFSIIGELTGTKFTNELQISPDGKTLFAVDVAFLNSKSELIAIDIPTRTEKRRIPTFEERFIKLSADGRVVYINGSGFSFKVYDAETLDEIALFDHSDNGPGLSANFTLTGDFNSINPPTVQLTNIKDGDIIQRGKPFTFKWQTTQGTAIIAKHKIEFSIDGGQTFISQGELLSDQAREFTFQSPALLNDNLQVRLTVIDVLARKSMSLVKFRAGERPPDPTDTQAPIVSFTKPISGEKFAPGDTINITWSSSDNVGVVAQDLTFSTDGGATFPVTIAAGLSGSIQSFNYQIPSALETPSAQLRLVVKDLAGNSSQSVTPTFQIQSVPPPDTVAPVVTISSPSNTILVAGQPITVTWQSIDNVRVMTQELLLSLDNGGSFQTVATFAGGTSAFTLENLPNLDKTTTNAMVKITATDSAGNRGEQITIFTIGPALSNVVYSKPILTINGIGFTATQTISGIKVFINGKEVAAKQITDASNSSLTVKGNKKKLGLVRGNNSVVISVEGISSNQGSFTF